MRALPGRAHDGRGQDVAALRLGGELRQVRAQVEALEARLADGWWSLREVLS